MTIARALASLLLAPATARPIPDRAQVAQLHARFRADDRVRPGRTLALLPLPTGGCGGCDAEIEGMFAPLRSPERFGLLLVDDPRRADVLLVTGPAVRNAAGPLARAHRAMRRPGFVVAIGECAATGTPVAGFDPAAFDGAVENGAGYALTAGGPRGVVPVDLVIRGAPPGPDAILLGLLTLLEAAGGAPS